MQQPDIPTQTAGGGQGVVGWGESEIKHWLQISGQDRATGGWKNKYSHTSGGDNGWISDLDLRHFQYLNVMQLNAN